MEAYSWGALTSRIGGVLGWLSRVAWMFLLPFALLNLAHWARLELRFRSFQKASLETELSKKDREELQKRALEAQGAAKLSAGLLRAAGLLLTRFWSSPP